MFNSIDNSATNYTYQNKKPSENETADKYSPLETQRSVLSITNLPDEILQKISFHLHPSDYSSLISCNQKTHEKLYSISNIKFELQNKTLNGELKFNYINLFKKCHITKTLSESRQSYRSGLETIKVKYSSQYRDKMEISLVADRCMNKRKEKEFDSIRFLDEFRMYLSRNIKDFYFTTTTSDANRTEEIKELNIKNSNNEYSACYCCAEINAGGLAHAKHISQFLFTAKNFIIKYTGEERIFMSLIMTKINELWCKEPPKNMSENLITEMTIPYFNIFSEGKHAIKHMDDIKALPALISHDIDTPPNL